MEDPMIPLAGGGLLALLIGYGAYRVVQRRRGAGGVDSSFMESRIQPDSFFGASGGQRIDTANSEMTTGGLPWPTRPASWMLAAMWTLLQKPTFTWPMAATCKRKRF